MAKSRIAGINIKIGADTTGVDKALSGIEGKSKGAKSELSEVNRTLKNSKDSVVLWEQKQKLLNEVLKTSKEKLNMLESAQEQIKKQFENKEIDDGQYRAFQREVEKAKSEVGYFEGEIQKAKESVDKLGGTSENAGREVDEMGDSLKDAGEQAENSSEGFTVLKGALANLLTEGIKVVKDGLKDLTENAMDFEDSMAKVSTIADATVPIDELQDSIVALSNQTGISSDEIADNVYNAISAGQKTADAVNFVENATKLSKAGFADTGNALDILTTVMNAYGMEASEVTRVSDVLIQTQNLGKTTVAELSSSMGKVIPTANAYGVSLEQLAAGYAIMTANGVATAESTTYMNAMLNELGKSGTGVSKILKEKTGKSFKELSESGTSISDILSIINEAASNQGKAFSDMWSSSQAGKAGLILLGDSAEKFNSTLADMKNATGATETAFEKLDTKSYQLQKTQNQLKNVGIKLGSEVLTAITPLAEKVLPKVEKSADWMIKNLPKILETGKKMLPVIKGVGAGFVGWKVTEKIGGGVDTVKKLANALKGTSDNAGLASGSIAGVATALAFGAVSLVAALAKAKREEEEKLFEKLTEESDNLAKSIDDNIEKMDKLTQETDDAAEADKRATERVQDLWGELQNLVDKNGRVKSGYEDRVKYIANELTEATGEKIKLIDGQIQKYDELKGTIEETIKKQRAQRLASIQGGKAEEAHSQMDAAPEEFIGAKEGIEDSLKEFKYLFPKLRVDSIEDLIAAVNKISGTKYTTDQVMESDDLLYNTIAKSVESAGDRNALLKLNENITQYQAAAHNLRTSYQSYNKLIDEFKKNQYIVDSYETAQAALAGGDYDEAIKLFEKMSDANRAALADSKASTDKRLKELETAVDKAVKKYNASIKLGAKDAKKTLSNTIKSIVEDARDGSMSAGELLNSGIVNRLSEIDGFDTSKLQRFIEGESIKEGNLFKDGFLSTISEIGGFEFETDGVFKRLIETARKTAAKQGSQLPAYDPWGLSVYGPQPLKMYADGGFITDRGIVAEAGPELIEIMNGGVKVTPLTSSARNTVVDPADQKPNVYYNNYTVNATVNGRYDITRIAEDLAAEQRRIERSKGR